MNNKIIFLSKQEYIEFKKNIFEQDNIKNIYICIENKVYISISKLDTLNMIEIIYYKDDDFSDAFLIEYYLLNGKKIKKITYNNGQVNDINNKPAIIVYNDKGEITKEFFVKNGNYHNINGPAIKEYANNLCIDCTYCINNIRFTEEKYYNYINSLKNGTILNTLYFTSYNKLKEILEIAKFYNNKEIQIECEKLLIIKKLEN